MAEITRRRQGEMMQAVFRVLLPHPDGLPARHALAEVERVLPPSAFEQIEYPNRPGVRRFEKIIRFTTINAVKAGWLLKNKGQWILTDEGREAYARFTDPEALMREAVRLYGAWKLEQPIEEVSEAPAVEEVAGTLEEAEEAAWEEIRQYLREMNPYDFQDLVAALLRAMGYHVAWVSPPGPDQGLDIVAFTDPLGAAGPRIKVQVKRRADRINVDGIRSFMALLGAQDVGIFISSGGFTSDADREARSQENRRLSLISIDRLIELWIEHNGRIPEVDRQLLPLKPVYFLSPKQ